MNINLKDYYLFGQVVHVGLEGSRLTRALFFIRKFCIKI